MLKWRTSEQPESAVSTVGEHVMSAQASFKYFLLYLVLMAVIAAAVPFCRYLAAQALQKEAAAVSAPPPPPAPDNAQ